MDLGSLLPGAIATSVLTRLILAGALLYVARLREGGPAFYWWSAAFGLLGILPLTTMLRPVLPAPLGIGIQVVGNWWAILVLTGAWVYSGRPVAWKWLLLSIAALTAWGIYALTSGLGFQVYVFPVIVIASVGQIASGAILWRGPQASRAAGSRPLGAIFFASGLHALSYPFIRQNPALASAGFMVANALYLLMALALILLLYRRQQQRAETALTHLAAAELKFSKLIEQSHVAILVTSGERPIYANPAFAALYGYESPDAVLALAKPFEWLGPDREKVAAIRQQRLRGDPAPAVYEHQGRRTDGSPIWVQTMAQAVDWGGTPAVLAMNLDVTPRKTAEEQARRAHSQLLDAIESLPGALFLLDAQRKIVLWNSRLLEYFPEARAVVRVGAPFEALVNATARLMADDPTAQEDWKKGRLENIEQNHFASEVRLTDGRWIQGLDRATSDGGRVCFRLDITEAKRREQELRQSQKLEAIGQFTSGIVHDFNNVLQIVTVHAALMRKKLDSAHPMALHVQAIADAAAQATTLTQQLRRFRQNQPAKMTVLDINEIVAPLKRLLAPLLGDHITLELQLADHLPGVLADWGMMDQVIMNLVINARDALADGGKITLATEQATMDAAFCANNAWARPGDYVALHCFDNGMGMAPGVLERIFEPFFTTKADRGTGLGLSTVFDIVQGHHGLIHVTSGPGQGSHFAIYLPPADSLTPSATPEPHHQVVQSGRTILVADDSPPIRDLTAAVLRDAGYTVFACKDGESAYLTFADHVAVIDLVVLDILMPQQKGTDAYSRMQSIKPGLKAIFASGWFSQAEELDLASKGLFVLRKPFSPDELLHAVADLLQES